MLYIMNLRQTVIVVVIGGFIALCSVAAVANKRDIQKGKSGETHVVDEDKEDDKKKKKKKKKDDDEESQEESKKKVKVILDDMKEYHTNNRVHFEVKLLDEFLDEYREKINDSEK